MKIGIMGAMQEEVQHLQQAMKNPIEQTLGERTYYSGTLDNIDVTLVFSRWGKVAASSTVTTLINKFDVDFVIFTGVAGAVAENLNIGDIVIGNKLYQHDMDASPLFPKFHIPLTKNMHFNPSEQNIKTATSAVNTFLKNINSEIPENTLSKFSIFKPQLHIGTIASGDQFVSNAREHENLKLESEKVLAVEMEGAAVAQVCEEHRIPFMVFRTISDKADHSAKIDFQLFVTEIASHYSSGIVKEFMKTFNH